MIRLLLLLSLLPTPPMAEAAAIAGRDLEGQSLICGPGSTANNSIPCSPNDILNGVFSNVGLFQINAGTTVFVTPGIPLVIFASTISISGALNGSGRGEVGGIGGDSGQPGGDGEGRGPGIGAAADKGGGGGGYGGAGGDGAGSDGVLGTGGSAYDDPAFPVSTDSFYPGSGGGGGAGSGGQTGGSGGQGGASIYLEASSFTLSGSISVRGVPGGNSTKPADAGGGGAGGSLLLRCMDSTALGGAINASGGKGGDAAAGSGYVYPGGGGGGGRVKIYYRLAAFSVGISTAGGAKGIKSGSGGSLGSPAPQAGSIGTVSFAIVASSPCSLTFPAVFATSVTWSWTAAPNWGNADETSRKYRLYSGTVSYRTPDRSPQLTVSSYTVSATETGLIPNTTYTRYATAFTDHSDSLPSNSVSPRTLASRPGAAGAFTTVTAASLNLTWGAGEPANPDYTNYETNRSTDINFGINVSTSYATVLFSAPAGLTPNTTYHFRVRAVNLDNVPTGFTPVVSTATLAVEPAGPYFAQVGSTSFIFNWSGAGNPPQTRYIAEISTDNFATLVRSSSTLNPDAAFTDLAVNALYYARVKAQNHNAMNTAFTAVVTTFTITAPPLNDPAPFTNVSANSLTFIWKSGGNSAGINYNPEISTNSDFSTPVSSDVTTNLNYVFTGLSANTTYYAHVRALGAGGLASLYSSPIVSTVTLTLPPVPAALPFTEVFAGSFTFIWENGGNPDGTRYTAEISRDGFVSVSSAIRTSAMNAAFSALTANTIYQARVRAVNFAGIPGQYSSPIVSTATTISAPVNAAIPFLNLSADGLTFSWGNGGNAPGTNFNPEISTDSSFSAPISSDVTTNLNYVFTGLSANTTYYAHIRAVGAGGNPTSYTSTVSTVTYTLAPETPASPFTGISTSSFIFTWSEGGNPLNTRYIAELSRNSFATMITSTSTLSISAAFSGLTPNTIYQIRAKALNFLGVDGPYSSPIRSTTTLATVPFNADQPFTSVSATTFTFTWADGGNPGGTSYIVEISSADFAQGTAISSAATLALSQTLSGLLPNTTYYGRVKAVNMDNIPGGYSQVVTAVTLPLPPALTSPPFSGVGSSGLTLSWTANGNPQNTTYMAEISGDNFVSISFSSTTLSSPAAFTDLTPNTTYTARVKAVNFAGNAGPYSSPVVSTATLAMPPQSAVSAFTLIDGGLTVQWSAGGNPPGTRYEAEVSTRSDFAPLWAAAVTAGVSRDFALTANTTYYARVRARNYNGIPTADLEVGGELTYAAQPAASASSTIGLVDVTTFSFTSTVSTGPGGLLFYRTVWDRNATHAWSNQESSWTASEALTTTATGNGYWYLHLRSYNFNALGYKTADLGPFHVALSAVTPPGQPVPAPGAFTATSGITWNWPPAITFGEAVISTYIVSVGNTPADFNLLVDSAVGPLAGFTLDPADNGKTYYLKARAIDEGGGLSSYSAVSSPGVLVDRTAPERPGAVRADRKFSYDSAILFSWYASADPESGIKDYLLDLGTTLNGNDIFNAKNMGLTLSYQAAGLPSGKAVFARVRAENNAGGFSDYSESSPGIPVWTLDQALSMVKPYNWPNPFNPMDGPTQIGFFLEAPAKVTLKLFTLEGNLVYEETHAESSSGNKVWPWAGRNGTGKMAAPGGYVCIIEKRYADKTERQQFKLAVLY